MGHTIAISRGLLDVLPDEASLAMVLAQELAHIALDTAPPPSSRSTIGPCFPTSESAAFPFSKPA
jgi:hypothetical protein